jgi:hypothetical protein
MQIEHKGGVKAMTDEELERGMEAIQAMLDAKAKVIDGEEPRCSITSNVSRRDHQLALTSAVAQRRRQGLGGEPSHELCGR